MSETFEHREYLLNLFDCYGELLTDKQKGIFMDVYELDLSFSEVAENLSISKAAVSDSIKRTVALLEEYERVLGVVSNKKKRDALYQELESGIVDISTFLKQIQEIDC